MLNKDLKVGMIFRRKNISPPIYEYLTIKKVNRVNSIIVYANSLTSMKRGHHYDPISAPNKWILMHNWDLYNELAKPDKSFEGFISRLKDIE